MYPSPSAEIPGPREVEDGPIANGDGRRPVYRFAVTIAAGIGWIFQSTPSRVMRDSPMAVPPDRHQAERSRGEQPET